MSAQTLDAFFRALKKGAPSGGAYLLHGPEDVLKDEAVRAIVDRVLDPALRDFNFDQRSAAQLDAESLFALCTTLPMMAERRVVVLRDVEALKRKPRVRSMLLRYLQHPSPETVLVLVQGAGDEEDREIARAGISVACTPLPPDRVLRWLRSRAEAVGVRLEDAAAEHLVRAVGGELGLLGAELAKLAALSGDAPLSAEQVGNLVGVRQGETPLDWRDALFDGRTDQAVRLLGPVLDQPGNSGVKLVTLVGTTLIGVGIARTHLDRKLRGRALEDAVYETIRRARPFGLLSWGEEKSRWIRWASVWPAGRVRAALRAALEADVALKGTTVSDERGILTDLVLRMAAAKREAA